jgi:hypothetical protein
MMLSPQMRRRLVSNRGTTTQFGRTRPTRRIPLGNYPEDIGFGPDQASRVRSLNPLEHAGQFKPPPKIFLSVTACTTRDTRAFDRAKKGLYEKEMAGKHNTSKHGASKGYVNEHPLLADDMTQRFKQPPRKPIQHFKIPPSGCSICGEPENAFAPSGHGYCSLCFLHIREVASWTGAEANFCPMIEQRRLYDLLKSASYLTGGDADDRVPYLKHSVLDMLVDNIFTEPPPGKRGSLYGEDLDGRFVKITPEEAAKEQEYERGAMLLKQPATRLKLTKFLVERWGFRYGVQLAWRAWVLSTWETRVRKFLQRHPQYEKRTPYKLLTQVFGEWAELLREAELVRDLRMKWARGGGYTRKRRVFTMKRALSNLQWGYTGSMLSAFRNLEFNVGFDMLEDIWKRAFEKDSSVKDMTKKACIVTFDSVRTEILAEEALSRWFQYFKTIRKNVVYKPPSEKGVLDSLIAGVRMDLDLSRATFDACKEDILSMMITGQGLIRGGKLERMLSTNTPRGGPQSKRDPGNTPEKLDKPSAGARTK